MAAKPAAEPATAIGDGALGHTEDVDASFVTASFRFDCDVRVGAPAVEQLPGSGIAVAWECSTAEEGESRSAARKRWSPTHLRFALSEDGGISWSEDTVPMHGLCSLHSPVLFWDAGKKPTKDFHTDAGPAAAVDPRLLLFYTEARKTRDARGGDVKCIASRDRGATWSPPTTLLTHEAEGGCAKCLGGGCRLSETRAGAWLLPFWRQPHVAYNAYHGAPPGRVEELHCSSRSGCAASAGVLISRDRGRTWRACGRIKPAAGAPAIGTWRPQDFHASGLVLDLEYMASLDVEYRERFLTHGVLAELDPRAGSPLESRLTMLLLRGTLVFRASSKNGGESWSDAEALPWPRPIRRADSLGMCRLPAVPGALLATSSHGGGATEGGAVHFARSDDGGETWRTSGLVPLPSEGQLHLWRPSMMVVDAGAGRHKLVVAYSGVAGEGGEPNEVGRAHGGKTAHPLRLTVRSVELKS